MEFFLDYNDNNWNVNYLGAYMLNIVESFSDGVYLLSECLMPLAPQRTGGFTKDKEALSRDFLKLEKDLNYGIVAAKNKDDQKKRD